jgi:hypothetical protein
MSVLPKSSVLSYVFCGQMDSMQSILINKCFLFMVGRLCRVKRFSLSGKRFADDEEVEKEVRKWLDKSRKTWVSTHW